jgi:hypothetical protein
MVFDLHYLIHPADLGHLNEPFSTEEIDAIVKGLPADKARGPYGFNGMFIKNAGTSLSILSMSWFLSFIMVLLICGV